MEKISTDLWNLISEYNRDEGDVKTAFSRAKVSYDCGNFKNAILDLIFYLKSFPNEIEAIFLRANCYYHDENYSLAVIDFENAFSKPDVIINTDDLYSCAFSLDQIGKSYEAIEYLDKILETNRTNKEVFYLKASILDSCNEKEKAVYFYSMAINLDNKMWHAYSMRGQCYFFLENWELSIHDYKEAFKISDDLNPRAHLILGLALYNSGKIQEGIAEITNARNLGDTKADEYLDSLR